MKPDYSSMCPMLLLAVLLLASCSSAPKWEPTLAVTGKSYAAPEATQRTTFVIRVFDDNGDFSNSLEHQSHAQFVRPLLLAKGFTEKESGAADLLITVQVAGGPAASRTTERTVPTVNVVGGGTSMVNRTTYTPSGAVRSQGTVTTPSTIITGQRTVKDTTVYQVGRIEIIAMDQRFYDEHPELPPPQRMRQVWTVNISYSYDLPLTVPDANFYPRLLRLYSDRIGVQLGEWRDVTTLTKLLDQPK